MPATREISIKRGIASIRSRKENEEEEREREREVSYKARKSFLGIVAFSSITFRFSLSIVVLYRYTLRDNFIYKTSPPLDFDFADIGSDFNKRVRDTFNRARERKDVETTLNNANGRASADAKTRGPKKKEKKQRKKRKNITLEKQRHRDIEGKEEGNGRIAF